MMEDAQLTEIARNMNIELEIYIKNSSLYRLGNPMKANK